MNELELLILILTKYTSKQNIKLDICQVAEWQLIHNPNLASLHFDYIIADKDSKSIDILKPNTLLICPKHNATGTNIISNNNGSYAIFV